MRLITTTNSCPHVGGCQGLSAPSPALTGELGSFPVSDWSPQWTCGFGVLDESVEVPRLREYPRVGALSPGSLARAVRSSGRA